MDLRSSPQRTSNKLVDVWLLVDLSVTEMDMGTRDFGMGQSSMIPLSRLL